MGPMEPECENIALIGVQGPSVDKISSCLNSTPTSFKKMITLHHSVDGERLKLDGSSYLVLVVDMMSVLSLNLIKKTVKLFQPSAFLSRCILVIVNSETPTRYAYPIEVVFDLCDTYQLQSWFCTVGDDQSVTATSRAVLKENVVFLV
mmetsp:Transcript_7442/g.9722  ORF Transcript_7442/g.9722 Transcript_7442/m.9722 type:complete len:148 (+) Transcript_7442:158-601(+)